MPSLPHRSLGWCKDSKELYIGTEDGNVKVGADQVAAQALLDEGADLAAVVAAFNALVEAMKASGVMST